MRKTNFLTFSITCVLLFISSQLFSQVQGTGMGTLNPHESAALEVASTTGGMLIPRMTVEQKNNIVAPATGLLVYDTTSKCISQNTGTPTEPLWVCLHTKNTQNSSFYMPSIAIKTSNVGTSLQLDLYEVYKKQFNAPVVKSTNAPSSISYFPKATDLYYYVIQYDENILQLTELSAMGILNYKVIKQARYSTFINVVFVVKE